MNPIADNIFGRSVFMGKRKAITKKSVTLRLDPDVIEFYRAKSGTKGLGYQTGINTALKELMHVLQYGMLIIPKIELTPEQIKQAEERLQEINAEIRKKKIA